MLNYYNVTIITLTTSPSKVADFPVSPSHRATSNHVIRKKNISRNSGIGQCSFDAVTKVRYQRRSKTSIFPRRESSFVDWKLHCFLRDFMGVRRWHLDVFSIELWRRGAYDAGHHLQKYWKTSRQRNWYCFLVTIRKTINKCCCMLYQFL